MMILFYLYLSTCSVSQGIVGSIITLYLCATISKYQKSKKMKRTVLLLLVYALWYVIAHGQNMNDSTVVLNEVVVKSIATKTKLRGDAIVTKVQGSALEKSGSLHEMLGKMQVSPHPYKRPFCETMPSPYAFQPTISSTAQVRTYSWIAVTVRCINATAIRHSDWSSPYAMLSTRQRVNTKVRALVRMLRIECRNYMYNPQN